MSFKPLPLLCRVFLIVGVSLSYYTGIAQSCTPVYHKTYSAGKHDEALFILSTPDKGAIVAGRTTSSNTGSYDGFLMKVAQDGSVQWSNSYGNADYEELTRAALTPDGGYIAIGITKSYTNVKGLPFLLKTTAGGTVQWAVSIATGTTGIERPKDLIVLHDGSYALLINLNDSTPQADGLICRLSSTGNLMWAKTFDHGNDDGFNTLVEEADSLVVGGHATITDRDAIVMKISSATGNSFWAKKYVDVHTIPVQDETIKIEKIPGGLAFVTSSVMRLNPYMSLHLGFYKRSNEGTHYYEGTSDVSPGGGNWQLENVVPRLAPDGGFIYFMNDSTDKGWSDLVKMDNGLAQFGRQLWNNTQVYARMTGLDTAEKRGYWVTGFSREYFTTNNRIELFKLDNAGYSGECAPTGNADFADLEDHSITDFTWNTEAAVTITSLPITPVTIALNFVQTTTCDSVYCDVQPILNDSCKSTFLMHLRSDARVDLYDVEATNDGGTIATGRRDQRPFITKFASDGNLQWSKSFTRFFNYSYFKKIIPTKDDNFLLIGINNITINHGSYTKSLLVKIDQMGNIIWSKDYEFGGDFDIYNAISTDDGGFIVIGTGGYGGGGTYPHVLRLSSTGEVVWQKTPQDNIWGRIYKGIYLNGDELYLLADVYQPRSILRVERWNASTGQMLWNKVLNHTNDVVFADLITRIKDTVYVVSHVFDDFYSGGNGNVEVAKFSPSGTYHGNYRLINPNHTGTAFTYDFNIEHSPFAVVQTSDSNLVMAQQSTSFGGKKLAVTKFTPSGDLIWARQYPNLSQHLVRTIKTQGDNLLIAGRIFDNYYTHSNLFSGFIMKTDLNGIIRKDAMGFCQSDTATANTDLDPFEVLLDPSINVIDGIEFTLTPVQLESSPLSLESELQCSLTSVCSVVNLVGPTSTCSLTDTITYVLNKNVGCISPAAWVADTAFVKIISSNDSSLKLLPKRSGLVKISARLQTGCSGLTKEITLNIIQGAGSLSLGPDTTICPGNTIKLKARPGFASYLWNDGSTDSVLNVTAPGSYHVMVTDSCGSLSRDTVIVSPQAPIQFYVGPDRTKCNNDTLHIEAPSGFLNYTWSNNYNINSLTNQHVVVYPSVDTSYFVRAEKTPGCFAFDTIHIDVYHSPAIQLGTDASFCNGDSLVLDAGPGFNSYQWNNGNTSQQFTAKNSGSYQVIGTTTEGCKSYDTLQVLNVWQNPAVSLDPNTGLCAQSTRVLDAGAFSSYLWQDGSTNRTFTVNSLGDYFVMVTDSRNCKGYDTVHIETILPVPSGFLAADTSICAYATLHLAPNKNFVSYAWSNGSANKTISVSQSGMYWLQVKDNNNCNGKDTIIVLPKDCLEGVFIPNAFTPNKSGKNDVFRALVNGPIKSFELSVYNRWGQLVFQTREWSKGWDGTLSGHAVASDTFVWMCRYQFEGEEEKIEKGTVLLIR